MRWRAIHYNWPEAASLLILTLILLWGFIKLYHYRQKKLSNLADPRILALIQEPRRSLLYWIKSLFFCTAFTFGVLALMGPKGNGHYPASPLEQINTPAKPHKVRQIMQDVVFLIDASASMNVSDARTGQTRFEEAKEIVEEVISRLRGQNTALYAFTSTTLRIVPLTTDYLFSRLMLRQISINEGETAGTDMLQAVTLMRDLFFNTTKKQTSLIMLTDGDDTHLETLQGTEREAYIQKITGQLQNADEKQLHVYVIGLGSLMGKEIPGVTFEGHTVVSVPNEGLLRQIAQSARGDFFLSREMTTLQTANTILNDLKANQQTEDKMVNSPRIGSKEDDLVYDLYYQIPLGIGILALTLALLLPETRRKLSLR